MNYNTASTAGTNASDLPDYTYKIVLLGDSNVGKSNICIRYKGDKFNMDSKPTIGVELSHKKLTIDGKTIKASIWDTAGQERYRTITTTYYRNSAGILLVYDITKRESFEHIDYWLKEVYEHADENVIIILVGNKTDLSFMRAVSQDEGAEYAKSHGMFFVETSAEKNTNIDKAFEILINEIHKKHATKMLETSVSAASLPKSSQKISLSNGSNGVDAQANGTGVKNKGMGCCSMSS